MKKTFPVNINGAIFYIDEDAYLLLNTYLEQLRKAFPGADGDEIIPDIEARIAEHFAGLAASGTGVISLADVNVVIEKMGRPAELNPEANEAESSHGPATPPPFEGDTPDIDKKQTVNHRLYRDERNKVLGGVLSGVACYMGWNPTILRLLYVILALCTQIFPLAIVYLIAWMVIPPARTSRQILEMTGKPVNLGTVGETILGTADGSSVASQQPDVFQSIFASLGKIFVTLIGIAAACTGLVFMIGLVIGLCGLVLYAGWGSVAFIDQFNFYDAINHPLASIFGVITLSLAIALPCLALVWGACTWLFKASAPSKTFIWTAFILEIIFIVAATVLITIANMNVSIIG